MFRGPLTRAGVVLPVPADPAGLAGPTRWQARGPLWRTTSRGLFVPAEVDSTVLDQRIVEAAVGMPDTSAVTGWAALAWLGTRWFDGLDLDGSTLLPVPISLGDRCGSKRRRGELLAEDWLFDDDIVCVDGLSVTVPERAICFEARRAHTVALATRVIDLALAADLFTPAELLRYAERLVARPGVRRLRRAIGLADENVWSPLETEMRLRWRNAVEGASLLCNAPVFDDRGRLIGIPDLIDPSAGVLGEYNGLVHLKDGVRRRDLTKESDFRDHDLEVVAMVNSDLGASGEFERRLAAGYRRATGGHGWTIEQPGWWVDTSTVEKRRALTAEQRERWLSWRAG